MNSELAAWAFWVASLALVYTYVGYPLLLRLLGGRRSPARAPARREACSVIVAAYNEERVIARKLSALLAQLGPQDELAVVSDSSTDATEEVVGAIRDPRLRLLRQEPRQGKNAALNLGVRYTSRPLLVFTDADAIPISAAVERLLAPFAEPAVGLVSGQGLYGGIHQAKLGVVPNVYVRYEAGIRWGEAALGFMAGVDGALYAMRRELYSDLPHDQVHDLLHPIQVALARRRVVFVPDATTVEPPSPDALSERRRQVRITAQGFRVLASAVPLLLVRGRFKELWILTSHRALRWLSWLALLVALTSSVALLDSHPLYRVLLAAQVAFFIVAAVGGVAERLSVPLGGLAVPYYFCVVSYAGLAGLLEALRGRVHAVWTSGGRSAPC